MLQIFFPKNGDFKRIGLLAGMSLLEGGSGFPFLAPSIYQYVCGVNLSEIHSSLEEIPDAQLKLKLEEVRVCIFTE